MSRYPKKKSPEKPTSSRSLTPSEPSVWTSTATSAWSSEKLSAVRRAWNVRATMPPQRATASD